MSQAGFSHWLSAAAKRLGQCASGPQCRSGTSAGIYTTIEILEDRRVLSAGQAEFDPETDQLDVAGLPKLEAAEAALFVLNEGGQTAGDQSRTESADPGGKWFQPDGPGTPLTVTYSFSNLLDGQLPGDLTTGQLRTAVQEVLELWAGVAPLHFVEVSDSGPAVSSQNYSPAGYPDIRIGHQFLDGSVGENILAQAFFPGEAGLGGDVHFDDANIWRIGSSGFGSDFLEVVVHELGHSLGIAHLPAVGEGGQDAVMNQVSSLHFSGGLGTAFLLPADVAAVREIYGTGVGSVTPFDFGEIGSDDSIESSDDGDALIAFGFNDLPEFLRSTSSPETTSLFEMLRNRLPAASLSLFVVGGPESTNIENPVQEARGLLGRSNGPADDRSNETALADSQTSSSRAAYSAGLRDTLWSPGGQVHQIFLQRSVQARSLPLMPKF